MIKIIILNILLLASTKCYNIESNYSREASDREKLIQYVIDKYKVSESEAISLLRFCSDLQSAEDFKIHALRAEFECHFRDLLKTKKSQAK